MTADGRGAGESLAALSLGSNLGDSRALLDAARAAVSTREGVEVVAESRRLRTAPQGVTDQAPFLNQVLLVRTVRSPWQLLDACLEVERELGRARDGTRWGPRTIDVDVLAYGGLTVRDERLRLPHPALPLRPFFYEMLAEVGGLDLLP